MPCGVAALCLVGCLVGALSAGVPEPPGSSAAPSQPEPQAREHSLALLPAQCEACFRPYFPRLLAIHLAEYNFSCSSCLDLWQDVNLDLWNAGEVDLRGRIGAYELGEYIERCTTCLSIFLEQNPETALLQTGMDKCLGGLYSNMQTGLMPLYYKVNKCPLPEYQYMAGRISEGSSVIKNTIVALDRGERRPNPGENREGVRDEL